MEEHSETGGAGRLNSPAKFVVLMEKTDSGYSGYIPDLPGCVAAGDSKSEVRTLLNQAIEWHVEALLAKGETLPESSTTSELIEVGRRSR